MALIIIPTPVMIFMILPTPWSVIELSTPKRTNNAARLFRVKDVFSGLAELLEIHSNIDCVVMLLSIHLNKQVFYRGVDNCSTPHLLAMEFLNL